MEIQLKSKCSKFDYTMLEKYPLPSEENTFKKINENNHYVNKPQAFNKNNHYVSKPQAL